MPLPARGAPVSAETGLTQVQEKFAQGVAMGLSFKAAAMEAGYSQKYAAANAFNLARTQKIARRIEQIRGPAVPTAVHPDLATLSLPAMRAMILNEAWGLLQDAKAARDRRTAISALSLVSDIVGLKSANLRVEHQPSPLDNLTAQDLQALIRTLGAPGEIRANADRHIVNASPL